jgi:hypothetical protein
LCTCRRVRVAVGNQTCSFPYQDATTPLYP